ncbi:MAG: zinc ribbon domain-containing protein [Oscillospiraceae bacterium]
MYCNQCGNILPDGSMFCSFCGAKNNLPPKSTAVSANSDAEAADVSAAVKQPEASPAHSSAPSADSLHAEPICSQPEPMFRQPEPIPDVRAETPRMAPNFGSTVQLKKEKAEKPVKYYTFGHIALCLTAVAIMAIVAGVFAGLYFTAV